MEEDRVKANRKIRSKFRARIWAVPNSYLKKSVKAVLCKYVSLWFHDKGPAKSLPANKAEIARLCKLSKNTASVAVDDLKNLGFLVEISHESGAAGRLRVNVDDLDRFLLDPAMFNAWSEHEIQEFANIHEDHWVIQ